MLIDHSAPVGKPETAQMVVIHNALRREFGLLPGLVGAVREGDTARAKAIAQHASILFTILHDHHNSEDSLLWPPLLERVPLQNDLIDVMESQHRVVAELSALTEKDLPPWTTAADAPTRDRLADHLSRLSEALNEHLALEELSVLPLIHDHLTVAEWEAAQKAAAGAMPSGLRTPMLMAGIILEDATPDERSWFMHELPAPARPLWRLLGRRIYATHVRTIRGPQGA